MIDEVDRRCWSMLFDDVDVTTFSGYGSPFLLHVIGAILFARVITVLVVPFVVPTFESAAVVSGV